MTRRATGPITAKGKAVSSQNARRHGLNAPPDEGLVTTWFNLVLDNGEGAYEKPNPDDPRRAVALRLAIAEARYHRALHKVDTHDTEPNSAQQVANKLHADVRFILDGLPRVSPTDRWIRLTWNTPSLACGRSRSCSSRWGGSGASTGATSARRGRSAGKRHKLGVPLIATKT